MSQEQQHQTKLRELDLLKSILETDPGTDTGFVSSSLSNSGQSSRMGDYSSQAEDHVRLSLPQGQSRPRSGKASVSLQKNSENEFMRVDVNMKHDGSHYNDYQEVSQIDTIHLENGINYTPLIKRSPRSPRRVTSVKVTHNKPRARRVDPLMSKYAELQDILSADMPNSGNRPALDPYLTRKAQQLMVEYKLAQSGQIPVEWLNARGVSLPNIGKTKGKGRKSKYPKALHAGRQTLNFGSQTISTEEFEDNRYDENEDESYVLIDATNKNHVKTRKVTFANPRQGGEAESVYSNTDTDIAEIEKQYSVRGILRGRPFSAPTYKSKPVVRKKPRIQSGTIRNTQASKRAMPPKPKKFLPPKKSQRPRSARESSAKSPRNKKRESLRSSSRSSSRDRSKSKSRSRSSSKDSRSSRSRSDSRSRSRARSRSRSRSSYSSRSSTSGSSRSRSRSESRSRSHSPKIKLDHQLKNTDNIKIKEWLKEKNKEYRKMQRQKRKEAKKKLKEQQKEEEKRQKNHEKSELAVKEWIETKKKETLLIRKKNREERARANQSFETVSSQGTHNQDNETASEPIHDKKSREKPKRTRTKKKQMKAGLQKNSDERDEKDITENTNEEEKKKRLSYDEWVATKRQQDQENMKQALRRKEEQIRNSDPDMGNLISKVGQNRISKIKEGKKRIDTGVKKIDDEANTGFSDDNNNDNPKYQLMEADNEPKPLKKIVKKKKLKRGKVPEPPQRASSPPLVERPVPPATPKPQVQSDRKQRVKYAQRSWDQFSDYVWDKLNDSDGEMERPEPQGSDKPDPDPRNESAENSSVSSKHSDESDQVEKDNPQEIQSSEGEHEDFHDEVKASNEKIAEDNTEDKSEKDPTENGEHADYEDEKDNNNEEKDSKQSEAEGEDDETREKESKENENEDDAEKELQQDEPDDKGGEGNNEPDEKLEENEGKLEKDSYSADELNSKKDDDDTARNSDSDSSLQSSDEDLIEKRSIRPRTGKVRRRIENENMDASPTIKENDIGKGTEDNNDCAQDTEEKNSEKQPEEKDLQTGELKEGTSENETGTFLTETVE